MKIKALKILAIAAVVALGLIFTLPAHAETVASLGKATGFVNDYAGVFSSGDKAQLTSICEELHNSSSAEMAIVTIRTTGNKSIESFAQELFTSWRIGQAESDNGVLILMAIDDREWRVHTGYGIEGVLPDSLAKRIMENEAVPEFKEGRFGQGLIRASGQMSEVIGGEEYASGGFNFGIFIGVFFVPIIVIIVAFILIWLAVRIKCPRCGSKVECTSNKEVLDASYSHSGIRKMDYECTVCHHVFSRMIIIPMLVEASSGGGGGSSSSWWSSSGSSGGGGSSFGGFSGGSSGGGGASGGW